MKELPDNIRLRLTVRHRERHELLIDVECQRVALRQIESRKPMRLTRRRIAQILKRRDQCCPLLREGQTHFVQEQEVVRHDDLMLLLHQPLMSGCESTPLDMLRAAER